MTKTNKITAGVSAIVVIAVLVWLLFFNGSHKPTPPVPHHVATCWAKPGVIGYAGPGKYVPIYTASGTRHGRGPLGAIICDLK